MRITKKRLNKIKNTKKQSRKKYRKKKIKRRRKRRSFRKSNKHNLRKKSLKFRGGGAGSSSEKNDPMSGSQSKYTEVYYLASDMYIKYLDKDKSGDPNKYYIVKILYDTKNQKIPDDTSIDETTRDQFPIVDFPPSFRKPLNDGILKNKPLHYINKFLIGKQFVFKGDIKEYIRKFIKHFRDNIGDGTKENYTKYFFTLLKQIEKQDLEKQLINMGIEQSEAAKWTIDQKRVGDKLTYTYKKEDQLYRLHVKKLVLLQEQKAIEQKAIEQKAIEQKAIEEKAETEKIPEGVNTPSNEPIDSVSEVREQSQLSDNFNNIPDIEDEIKFLQKQKYMMGQDEKPLISPENAEILFKMAIFFKDLKNIKMDQLENYKKRASEFNIQKDAILKEIDEDMLILQFGQGAEQSVPVEQAFNKLKGNVNTAFETIKSNLNLDDTTDTGIATADTGIATADTGIATADTGIATADTGIATQHHSGLDVDLKTDYQNLIKLQNIWKLTADETVGLVIRHDIEVLLNLIQKDIVSIFENRSRAPSEIFSISRLSEVDGLYKILHTRNDPLYLSIYVKHLNDGKFFDSKNQTYIEKILKYIYTFIEIWNFKAISGLPGSGTKYKGNFNIQTRATLPVLKGSRRENQLTLRLEGIKRKYKNIILILYSSRSDVNNSLRHNNFGFGKTFIGNYYTFIQSYTIENTQFVSSEAKIPDNKHIQDLLNEKYSQIENGLQAQTKILSDKFSRQDRMPITDITNMISTYHTLVDDKTGENIKTYVSSVSEGTTENPLSVERMAEQKVGDGEDADPAPPSYSDAVSVDRDPPPYSDTMKPSKEKTSDIYKEKKSKKEIPPIATISNINDSGGTSANLYISVNPNRKNGLGANVPGIIKLFNNEDSATQSVAGWIKNLGSTDIKPIAADELQGSGEEDKKVEDMEQRLRDLAT